MKKFKWERAVDYGRNGPKWWFSDIHQIDLVHNHRYMRARIYSRLNGPKTAKAEVFFSIEWPSSPEQHWGFCLKKHFEGWNAGLKARGWCNYLLTNPPDYSRVFDGTLSTHKGSRDFSREFQRSAGVI